MASTLFDATDIDAIRTNRHATSLEAIGGARGS